MKRIILLLLVLLVAGCTPQFAMTNDVRDIVKECYFDSMATVSYCDTGQTSLVDAQMMLRDQLETMLIVQEKAQFRPATELSIQNSIDFLEADYAQCLEGGMTEEQACQAVANHAETLEILLDYTEN